MSIPYEFVRVMSGKKPTFEERGDRLPEHHAVWLQRDNRMRGRYLGACLDVCRWGSQMTVLYKFPIPKMICFIQSWMRQNNDGFEKLWHEQKINKVYSRFELPYINHEKCPNSQTHHRTIRDGAGRVRCAHVDYKAFKPSFVTQYASFDHDAQMQRRTYLEWPPQDPTPDDDELDDSYYKSEEYQDYCKETEKYDNEKETCIVHDPCYAILSDKARILSLETVIKRLMLNPEKDTMYCDRLYGCTPARVKAMTQEEREYYDPGFMCNGHQEPTKQLVFPFDGWDLAFYVQKWWEQSPGKAPWFEKDKKINGQA